MLIVADPSHGCLLMSLVGGAAYAEWWTSCYY